MKNEVSDEVSVEVSINDQQVNNLDISLNIIESDMVSLTITDALYGTTMITRLFFMGKGINRIIIDMSSLDSPEYFLLLTSGNGDILYNRQFVN
ncbi:MAG: hypothetical protein A2275_04650 [Bacteroidetes bacterium RIFOXYA12_FULL_35_11]|nr:MAG: hypothetical protein A2X01_11170 [Bacteroidetes bacterium GWF2_35_48]OFY75457.1 MAG: hypothetical protein A2275_04650 [Bacteroidetes bacterium RIFOXYA12_FULL_35_11]OFY96116.1 MAG: hypothetical protein A2491_05870 [Bacteroidetes bacterium RIFOXYC12_FULL_35_7]HBX51322.1 hypothetical protein [Bacteroidales bacterium]